MARAIDYIPPQADVEKHKLNAIMSYAGLFILVPLLSDSVKYSTYAKFHLNQGLIILIAAMVASFVTWLPIVGPIIWIFMVYIWAAGLWSAIVGTCKRIPLIGNIELIK